MPTKAERLRTTPTSILKRQRAIMSVADMANAYGVSVGVVYSVLKDHGIRGAAGRCAKLTVSQVRQIRKDYANHRNASKIALDYGVTSSNVGDIVHGITWKWVK